MVRVVPVTPGPAGIALTHDGKLLVAAASTSAVVLDAWKIEQKGADALLVTIPTAAFPRGKRFRRRPHALSDQRPIEFPPGDGYRSLPVETAVNRKIGGYVTLRERRQIHCEKRIATSK